jgi:cytochrome c oxidase subunit I+III
VKLPLYVSGQSSIGWWAVFITMLADMTAYLCLVFGYFFFWTGHEDFPPRSGPGPGVFWPTLAAGLLIATWALTLLARRWNRRDTRLGFYGGLVVAMVLALGGAACLIAGPWLGGMIPRSHAYPATVWVLVLWTAFHVVIGVVMHAYCLARRLAGRMTAAHDVDIGNVVLFWHFIILTAVVTVAVIAGFPLVA